MRIVCPKCELRGQVDVTTTSAKTRIACVRCATTFDAVFADGRIQDLLPQASRSEMALERVNDDAPATGTETFAPTKTDLESDFNFPAQLESAPAPADDFSALATDEPLEMTLETSSPVSPLETATEIEWQDEVTPEAENAHTEAQAVSAFEVPRKSPVASKVGQPADAYGLGVRLMRVSPLWLLLAGLSFISFIVLCNWIIKPDENTGDMARMVVAADNHATNQSPSRVVPNSTAQSTLNNTPALPPTQSGASFIPAEATQAPVAKAAEPGAETFEKPAAETKPAVVEKAAVTTPVSNPASEAKDGKVTIQIGSYNESAQAEERVASLKSAGYEARSVAVEIPKRGTWYRVQSGRFVSRDDAERYGKQLREKGVVASYITTDVQE